MGIKVLIFMGVNEVKLYNLSIINLLKMKVTLTTLFLNAAAIKNLKCLIDELACTFSLFPTTLAL